MSFKWRNTLILLVIALIAGGASFYLFVIYFPGIFEEQQREIAQLNTAVEQIPQREAYNDTLQSQVERRYASLAKLDKTIRSEINLSEVFHYIDRIQDRFGSFRFNLRYDRQSSTSLYGFIEFTLSGEGTFNALNNFIYALEDGPQILIVDKLEMRGVENAPAADKREPLLTVPFDLKIRAPYAEVSDLPPLDKTLADVPYSGMVNLFYPLIAKNLPPNVDGLVEAERAELRAILPGKAVIADAEGKVHVLQEGDRVYLGFVTEVNQEENTVEFTLNKGGIVETYTMKLGF